MSQEPEPNASTGVNRPHLGSDGSPDQEAPWVACPFCTRPIPEETIRCPHCREWIIDRPSNEARRSPWFWPIVIAIGAAMILVILVFRLTNR